MKMTGIEVPCRDVAVKQDDLASLIFAMAFWDMQDKGLVTIELVKKKMLGLIPSKSVQVTKQSDEAPFPLESALLKRFQRSNTRSVHQVIYDWYGKDVPNPAGVPVKVIQQEALSLGYFSAVDAERNVISSKLLGSTKLVYQCGRIAELEVAASELKARWEQFRTAEPELSQALIEGCKGAISRRKESKDPDD